MSKWGNGGIGHFQEFISCWFWISNILQLEDAGYIQMMSIFDNIKTKIWYIIISSKYTWAHIMSLGGTWTVSIGLRASGLTQVLCYCLGSSSVNCTRPAGFCTISKIFAVLGTSTEKPWKTNLGWQVPRDKERLRCWSTEFHSPVTIQWWHSAKGRVATKLKLANSHSVPAFRFNPPPRTWLIPNDGRPDLNEVLAWRSGVLNAWHRCRCIVVELKKQTEPVKPSRKDSEVTTSMVQVTWDTKNIKTCWWKKIEVWSPNQKLLPLREPSASDLRWPSAGKMKQWLKMSMFEHVWTAANELLALFWNPFPSKTRDTGYEPFKAMAIPQLFVHNQSVLFANLSIKGRICFATWYHSLVCSLAFHNYFYPTHPGNAGAGGWLAPGSVGPSLCKFGGKDTKDRSWFSGCSEMPLMNKRRAG